MAALQRRVATVCADLRDPPSRARQPLQRPRPHRGARLRHVGVAGDGRRGALQSRAGREGAGPAARVPLLELRRSASDVLRGWPALARFVSGVAASGVAASEPEPAPGADARASRPMTTTYTPGQVMPPTLATAVDPRPYWFVIGGQAVRCFAPYRPSRDVDFGIDSPVNLNDLVDQLRRKGSIEIQERGVDLLRRCRPRGRRCLERARRTGVPSRTTSWSRWGAC